jgi:Zn-dependent protease with chaperone function
VKAGLVLFDLFVGAGVAFGGALGLVVLSRRLLRLEHGRLLVLLLAAPLVKAAVEVARGVPQGSYLWARLAGATRDLGTFQVGLGVSAPAVPVIHLSFGALVRGANLPQSLADGLAVILSRRAGAWLPEALGMVLASAAFLGFAVWFLRGWRAARREARLVQMARCIEVRQLGPRRVRILCGRDLAAVPCAGGLVRPWIWFPEETYQALEPVEREAVIAHELAHLRWFDGAMLTGVGALQAVFAFVPGTAPLVRRIGFELELAADQVAGRATSATALAAALVRVAELADRRSAPAPSLALLQPGSVLGARVLRLLGPPGREDAWTWKVRARFGIGVLVAVAAVLRSNFFGY